MGGKAVKGFQRSVVLMGAIAVAILGGWGTAGAGGQAGALDRVVVADDDTGWG